VLLAQPLQDALEELLQCVVGVLGPVHHLLQEVLSELLLRLFGAALAVVEELDRPQQAVLAVFVHLELYAGRSQEVVEDQQGFFDELIVANGNEQEVLELDEELEPRLGVLALVDGLVGITAAANHEDLHVLGKQRVVALLDDQVDQRVGHQLLVKVINIADQLVLEVAGSQCVDEGVVLLYGLVREDDGLGVFGGLHEHINVDWVQNLEVRKEGLQLEETDLLHEFGNHLVKAVVNDIDGHAQVTLQGVLLARGVARSLVGRGAQTSRGCLAGASWTLLLQVLAFLGEEVALLAVLRQDSNGELQALGFDLPVLLQAELMDLLSDIEDGLSVVNCDSVQDIERADSDTDLGVVQPNKSIVEEDIEPLLVELGLILEEEGVSGVHDLIINKVLLE